MKKIKGFLSVFAFTLLFGWACDDFQLYENIPVGNVNLAVTNLAPASGPLRGDTLTILGSGFNPIPYQNIVKFASIAESRAYVNENGEVTDSIIYVVTKYDNNPARVIDATPTSLKVIVSDAAISGPILVSYGVDTVVSPIAFNLISTSKRPIITSVNPQFGAPGTSVTISSAYTTEKMVASFGGTLVSVPNPDLTSSITFPVPNTFSGPTDLRIGSITEANDTLWSSNVNFGVLPSPQSVPFLITTDFDLILAKAEVVNGLITISRFNGATTQEGPKGIAVSPDSSRAYWIDESFTSGVVCTIYRASVKNSNANVFKATYGTGVIFSDLALVGNFLYAATNKNIRRFTIDADGNWGPATVVHPFSGDREVTNLKINGNQMYWVDKTNKKIVKATISGNALSGVEDLYTNLQHPDALAVNSTTGDLYFTDITAEGSFVYKGNVNTLATPVVFFTEKDNAYGFKDIEIDETNQFVYWSRSNELDKVDNGIFRKSYKTPTARVELVFQFPNPQYFDFVF